MFFKKYKKAFTLVELIIAIAVMSTIASFSTASFVGYKDMADREQGKLDIQQVKNAADNYYSANQKYPTSPLTKQPSPDIKDASGKVVFEGYSRVDVALLVEQRYLQDIPKLKETEYFAINFNGIVTIRNGISESVIVDNGNILVNTKVGDLVPFSVYTGKNAQSISVIETDKNYTISGSGASLGGSKSSEQEYEKHSGNVKVSNSQGQKYFVVRIKYSGGKSVDLRTTFQYALSSDKVVGDVYWRVTNPTTIDQSTLKGKQTPEILRENTEVIKDKTSIKLSWTNKELASGSAAIKYEIEKIIVSGGKETYAPDSPIITGNTEYIDSAVNSNNVYKYKIYAYAASKNTDGSNKKTLNYLQTPNVKPNEYKDTLSYIDNITKNDFNTANNKDVSVRVGDIDSGIMRVLLITAKVENGVIGKFNTYEMNKTKDGSSTVLQSGKTIDTSVYSVPVEVADDYMIYYIKVIDNRGFESYNYIDPSLVKNDKETDAQFEKRRELIKGTLPSNIEDSSYVLMRGLVEIFNDSYIDHSKIDSSSANYHLYDGKITLP